MSDFKAKQETCKSDIKSIKVFGVGGAGIKLIEHMMKYPTPGAEFIAIHGSAEALAQSSAHKRFLLGLTGRPRGRASDARHDAENVTNDMLGLMLGADIIMIVAAMGGATGGGVPPVIADIARKLRIHALAVVVKPFEWETKVRRVVAKESADQLACCADSVIEVFNQSAAQMLSVEEIEYERVLDAVNDAIGGIAAEIVGIVNASGNAWRNVREIEPLSLDDFRTVMRPPGKALVGTAVGVGPGRARMALEQALNSPLLEGMEISDAKRILVSITTAPGTLRSEEAQSIVELARAAAGYADLMFCAKSDPSYGDRMRVTVFGVGLHRHWEKPSAEWMAEHHIARRLPDAPL